MLTIFAQISTGALLEINGLQADATSIKPFKPAISNKTQFELLLDSISINYGIPLQDLAYLQYADGDNVAVRLTNGDDYTLAWEGKVLTGIDFSTEDAKNKFTVELSDSNILAGGSVTITVTLYEPDGVTIKSNVNTPFRLPFNRPQGPASVAMNFASGVATKTVTINEAGIYTIGVKRKGNFVLQGDIPVLEVDL
jgi:hypothetical protein